MDDAAKRLFLDTLDAAVPAVLRGGASLTPEQRDACLRYAEILLRVNEHTNLTRITEPAAVAVKHFADSLTVLRVAEDLPDGARVVDVGTGAGFPGMVLKIARPDLRLTLMDSLNKRLAFLREVADALGMENVAFVHARAEEAGRDPAHRDRYDLVTARAVAALPTLLEWCAPLARAPEGRFVAMKTEGIDEELAAAQAAARLLNLRLASDTALTLPPVPGEEIEEPAKRRLLVFEKTHPTPPRFPRRSAEIKARPLGQGK